MEPGLQAWVNWVDEKGNAAIHELGNALEAGFNRILGAAASAGNAMSSGVSKMTENMKHVLPERADPTPSSPAVKPDHSPQQSISQALERNPDMLSQKPKSVAPQECSVSDLGCIPTPQFVSTGVAAPAKSAGISM